MGVLQQLWLDLWGDAPAPAAPKKPKPKPAPTPARQARAAPETQELPELLPRHPDANRALALREGRVAYLLVRARRRSIGFTVGTDGLVVRAPNWLGTAQLDAALQEKSAWIVRQLARMKERGQRIDAARIAWQDGGQLPYLGRPLTLRLAGGAARTALDPQAGVLALALPPGAAADAVRACAQRWLMERARAHLALRLAHFAPQLAVTFTRWQLSSARTRWGSASASGVIRLNWRLMHHSPEVIDYVVVHELAHLRVMDHSPRFWAVVEHACPDYARLRRELREHPLQE